HSYRLALNKPVAEARVHWPWAVFGRTSWKGLKGTVDDLSHEASQPFQSVRLTVKADQDQMTGGNPMRCTPTVTPLGATVALVALCPGMVLGQDKAQPSFAENQTA